MTRHPSSSHRRARRVLAVTAIGLLIVAAAAPSAPARDRRRGPIDLGTLGGPSSFAIGINPAGTIIVGESDDRNGQIRPVAWLRGRIIDLGTPNAAGEADGLDVNDSGVIVGAYGQTDDPAATQHAFAWHDGTLRILPALPGGAGTYARRINAGGEIAGDAFTADGHDHPVLWDARGIHDLGLPPGYTDGYLLALNDEGDAGGAMFAADGSEAAFTWHAGRFHILPTLGGPTAQVNVLDDRGIAAGIADLDANGTSEATLWDRAAAAHGLGFFPGANFSWILGTNGHGDYTGIASLSPTDPLPHVFVAHTGGPLLALPPLSGDYAATPSIAHGIDRHDDVAGASPTSDGDAHATLWLHAFDQAFPPAPAAQTSRHTPDHRPHRATTAGRDIDRSWWPNPATRPVVPRPS
jgi:probable HAF family extracellular repeat protein